MVFFGRKLCTSTAWKFFSNWISTFTIITHPPEEQLKFHTDFRLLLDEEERRYHPRKNIKSNIKADGKNFTRANRHTKWKLLKLYDSFRLYLPISFSTMSNRERLALCMQSDKLTQVLITMTQRNDNILVTKTILLRFSKSLASPDNRLTANEFESLPSESI